MDDTITIILNIDFRKYIYLRIVRDFHWFFRIVNNLKLVTLRTDIHIYGHV